ncbi:TPA: hypothetical protein ACQXLH_002122, partial [Streptococcus pneumoniae]
TPDQSLLTTRQRDHKATRGDGLHTIINQERGSFGQSLILGAILPTSRAANSPPSTTAVENTRR